MSKLYIGKYYEVHDVLKYMVNIATGAYLFMLAYRRLVTIMFTWQSNCITAKYIQKASKSICLYILAPTYYEVQDGSTC